METRFDVAGLGNALLDFQVRIPFDFLDEIRIKKASMSLVETGFQSACLQKVQERFHQHVELSSGGCAANTLAGLASFGGRSYFFGKVGEDKEGRSYIEDLEKCGVTSGIQKDRHDSTGTCLALITPDAERTMLTHLGIATQLKETDITEDPIRNSEITYIEGYLWDSLTARAASMKAIQIARAQKRRVAFTFSDGFCVDRHRDDFIGLAKNSVDILFCNEHEVVKATGSRTPEEGFQIIKDWAPLVCVTLGPRGALLSDRSRSEVAEIGTWDVKLVDKLGAGDLFASGVLYGLLRKHPLKEVGYLGCYAATRVIQQMGARLKEQLSESVSLAIQGPTLEEQKQAASA